MGLWRVLGDEAPPTGIMNGGCAMSLPIPVQWPSKAVTFLLLGGQDYFRSNMSNEQYLADVQGRVPKANSTTAILFVSEMSHTPAPQLLMGVLEHMIGAVGSWKTHGSAPFQEFNIIMKNLQAGGWTGKLTYKTGVEE